MPSSRHPAFTAGVLLALALFLALAGGIRAQCPPPGGYRATNVDTDRFSSIKKMRTHLPPAYGPAVPNLYAFTNEQETVFALIFTSLAESIRYTRCSTVAILADGKPVKTQGGRFTRGTAIESAGLEVQNSLQAAALAYGKAHPLHLMPHAFFAESVTAQLDADAVAQLGVAQTIEFRICNDETSAPAEFVQAAHEFVCRLGQRPTPPTLSAAAAAREPPAGLCPALVVERLKTRGLSLETIQEICKP
jgi:hypothetical protein